MLDISLVRHKDGRLEIVKCDNLSRFETEMY